MTGLHHPLQPAACVAAVLAMVLLPAWTAHADQPFYLVLATRLLIFALAATSLNLVLGFAGMISFGHAAYIGVGAYAVAILMKYGIASAWVAFPVAMLASSLLAALVGIVSLRTRGVYFIMITLAFAQMAYYLFVSLQAFGGDDGLLMSARSSLGLGIDLESDELLYATTALLAALGFAACHRLVNSRFGRALQGIRENETRMEALGYPTFRIKLLAFTIAGALAGLAGALLANLNTAANPMMMHWSQSGILMVMVIVGGVGYLWGGVLGAVALLLLEEILSAYTIHWQFGLGAILLAIVLIAPQGLAGLVRRPFRAALHPA